MLIRFSVENFLSFCNEVEFSLMKGLTQQHKNHIVDVGDFKLLRGAAIYGANASGKSNLIKAMAFARQLIVEGTAPNVRIDTQPFKFSANAVINPQLSSLNFIIGVKILRMALVSIHIKFTKNGYTKSQKRLKHSCSSAKQLRAKRRLSLGRSTTRQPKSVTSLSF